MLRIAGRDVRLEGATAVRMVSELPGFDVFRATGALSGNEVWTVRFGCKVCLAENREVLYVFDSEEGSWEFSRNGDVYYFTMGDLAMQYRRGAKVAEATTTCDAAVLRFSLWFAFSLLSAAAGATLVHASAVVHGGWTVLFLGESGTGKSTHARQWLQHIEGPRLLNDDSPVVALEAGVPVVYGSPWSGKTPCYHQEGYPLSAVVRLSQALQNRIRRLNTLEAVAALQPSCPPALAYDEYFSDSMVALISSIIGQVPVYHLECLPDGDAACMCHETIFPR